MALKQERAPKLRPEDRATYNPAEEEIIRHDRENRVREAFAYTDSKKLYARDLTLPDQTRFQQELDERFKEDPSSHVFVKADLQNNALIGLLASQRLHGKAVYDPELKLWEVMAEDFALSPELQALPHISYAEGIARRDAFALLKEGMQIISDQERERRGRIYLDFVPASLHRWALDHHVHYDPVLARSYFSPADSGFSREFSTRDIDAIAACRRHRIIRPDMIESPVVTPGKKALAAAMNTQDRAQREFRLALALNICARESAEKQPGAIRNFSEVIRAFNRTGMRLSFKEGFRLAKGYYQAVDLMRVSHFFKTDRQWHLAVDRAALKAEKVLVARAGYNLEQTLDEDLRNAGRLKNDRELLAACAAAFEDHIRGHAFALAGSATGVERIGLEKLSVFNRSVFWKKIDGFLDDLRKKRPQSAVLLEQQIKGMARMTISQCTAQDQAARKAEAAAKDYIEGLPLEYTTRELAVRLTKFADDFHSVLDGEHYAPVAPKTLRDLIPDAVPDPEFEPLYVSATLQEREAMPEDLRSRLRSDPHTGLLCVQDSEENRRDFAAWFPDQKQTEAMREQCDVQQDRALQSLKDAGYVLEPDVNLFDGQAHVITDREGEKKQIWLDFGAKPQAVISGLKDGDTVTLPINSLSDPEIRKLSEDHEKVFSRELALQAQSEQKRAVALRESFKKLQPASVSAEDGMLFPWCDQLDVDVKDLGAFTDPQKIFRDSVFKGSDTASDSVLYIPMYNTSGRLMNALAVNDLGDQEFCHGAGIKGNFMVAGGDFEKLKKADTVILCVDPLSAAAMQKAAPKGAVVVAALNKSNLPYVAESIAKNFPKKALGFMAEMDVKKTQEKGYSEMTEAYFAAQAALDELKPYTEVFLPPLSKEQLSAGKGSFAQMKAGAEKNAQMMREVVASIRARENLHQAAYENGLDREESRAVHNETHLSNGNQKLDDRENKTLNAAERAAAAASRAGRR